MNNNTLIDAIGCLDTDLIEAHLKEKEFRMKKSINYHRTIVVWAALITCLCMFTAISVSIMYIQNNPPLEGPNTYYYQGDKVENSLGTITLINVDNTNKKATFHLIKQDNSLLYVKLTGYCVIGEFVGTDGISYQQVKHFDFISKYDSYKSNNEYEVINNLIAISFNEHTYSSMPSNKGEYEILIDYSALTDYVDYIRPIIEVSGFGRFMVESE